MSPPDLPFLPYGVQSIDEADIAAVAAALRADFLTTGPEVERFEADIARQVGAGHVVVCANGTAGLHLAAMAAGLGPDDTVIVPAITFVATANAARYCGARVVFADVDPDTGALTADSLQAAIRRADVTVAAVFPVHLAGQSVDMAAIGQIARKHGAKLIEDACHAFGSLCDDGPVGSCRHSDAAVFSFHPVKMLTSGEGGALVTQDAGLAARARQLRSHGISREAGDFTEAAQAFAADGNANVWYYEMQALGFNYRLPDINCSLGRSQLRRLDQFMGQRQRLVQRYDQLLSPYAPHLRSMTRRGEQVVDGLSVGWHLQVVLIDFEGLGLDRQGVMQALRQRGIGSQVHYMPVYRQPYYRALEPAILLPGAEAYYARCLSLPLFADMAESDVDRVVAALVDVLGL